MISNFLIALIVFALSPIISGALPIKNLAIYYGWPSSVNLIYTIPGAAAEFSAYDIVVFGAGLENSAHGDHANTKAIINASSAEFYGYVDATLITSTIQTAIDRWSTMGGTRSMCTGIFFDRFGFDYGLTRTKQNTIVDYAHSKNMKVFVNAWNPDDVFLRSSGKDHHLTSGSDWYLAESHYVLNGNWQSLTVWESKSDKMASYKISSGVNMACITTTTSVLGFNQTKWNNAYAACNVYGFDASGWGEPIFSASDALLPWRTRLAISGTKFTGPLIKSSGVFERQTNIGVHINTNTREVSSLLD